MRRLTAEIVNERIAVRGLKLVGEYTNTRTKTTFECKHGHQWDTPPGNVVGGHGCPQCANKQAGDRQRSSRKSVNERITGRGLKVVGEYTCTQTKTTFECEHGHQWDATPHGVMRGNGCPHCAGTVPLTKNIVNERIAVRGLKLVSEYTSSHIKTTFECEHGHQWDATPSNVMKFSGCPICADHGFNPDQPAILYILQVEGHSRTLFKVGITNGTVETRFEPKDLKRITVLEIIKFETGAEAREEEQAILKETKSHGLIYEGEPILRNGNTELMLADPRKFTNSIGDRHAHNR